MNYKRNRPHLKDTRATCEAIASKCISHGKRFSEKDSKGRLNP